MREFLLLNILFCIFLLIQSEIKILDAGIVNLRRGDVGMIFYVTVHNSCKKDYHVVVRMVECCEIFSDGERECSIMQLLGADMGSLPGNTLRNLSLIYATLYPYDRIGQCLVGVYYKDSVGTTQLVKIEIPFNTTISTTHTSSIMRNYYHPLDVSKCDTTDQDTLNNCRPVDCMMKYVGFRNHFNSRLKKCVRVPFCIMDPSRPLPNIVYVPVSNKCRDLENALTPEDVRQLTQGNVQAAWRGKKILHMKKNMHCHHGKMDNTTGFCLCDVGWASAPFNREIFKNSEAEIHMCTIRVSPKPNLLGVSFHRTIILFGLLAIAIIILFVVVVCFLMLCDLLLAQRFKCPKQQKIIRAQGGSTRRTTSSSAQIWHSSDFDSTNASSDILTEPTKTFSK